VATSINWNLTLPQNYEQKSYSEGASTNFIESKVDAGPIKRRRRTTAEYIPISVTMFLTNAQVNTFKTFYKDTIKSGTLSFNFPDINGDPYEVYLNQKTLKATSGSHWELQMNLTAIVI